MISLHDRLLKMWVADNLGLYGRDNGEGKCIGPLEGG